MITELISKLKSRIEKISSATPSEYENLEKKTTTEALNAAEGIVTAVYTDAPGIFPISDGGILIEWSSPSYVFSLEIRPDGTSEAFYVSIVEQDR